PSPACPWPGTLCDVHNYLMQRQRRQPSLRGLKSRRKPRCFPQPWTILQDSFFTLSTCLVRLHRTVVYCPPLLTSSFSLALSVFLFSPSSLPLAITSGK
uniref:Uncharacterized protein n=1 Tax=Pan paniscus TaxID=9597 RepID=A0A2R8ZF22_PANPA